MKKGFPTTILIAAIAAAATFLAAHYRFFAHLSESQIRAEQSQPLSMPVAASFYDSFWADGTVEETDDINHSMNAHWWLNSGAFFIINDGVGKTVQGEVLETSPWWKIYKDANNDDTDGGYHPQNIFRLIARPTWKNFLQEMYARIHIFHLSKSANRNESNGILLMSRYQDADNLYYVGVRVDGFAVIKKKYRGEYYTMAERQVFSSPLGAYDRNSNPSLLPAFAWIGLRSETVTNSNGTVTIRFFIDSSRTGSWSEVLSVIDTGTKQFGGPVLTEAGHAGIRTDFMDVEFKDYKFTEL